MPIFPLGSHLYTDTFNLIVVSLNQIELATDEDKNHEIDKWAKLFKSKTWEELKMVANGNEYMTSAVETVFLSNENKEIAKVARERDDYLRHEAWRENEIKKTKAELAAVKKEMAEKDSKHTKEVAELKKHIAELEAKNAQPDKA